jgi:hypothetical protein
MATVLPSEIERFSDLSHAEHGRLFPQQPSTEVQSFHLKDNVAGKAMHMILKRTRSRPSAASASAPPSATWHAQQDLTAARPLTSELTCGEFQDRAAQVVFMYRHPLLQGTMKHLDGLLLLA